jgi:hypothetical protein
MFLICTIDCATTGAPVLTTCASFVVSNGCLALALAKE